MDALNALHLLRPQWLWALLALPLLVAWWWWRRRARQAWRGVVDAHLLPHLLDAAPPRSARIGIAAGVLAYVLAVLVLAGPSWRQSPQPLWQSRAPLVVALDLSSAMRASDVPPSRLAVARARLAALLQARDGGQVGLVAFAGDAFTVAPLTDDAGNVALFLDALAPDVMPVDGQRVDRAIAHAVRLLQQGGFARGRVVVITDRADDAARAAAERAAKAGVRIDVLGLGSPAGAPYRLGDGRLVRARLDVAALRALARAGGGDYATVASDDRDLRALGLLDAGDPRGAQAGGARGGNWQDEGYWLLPPLMLLALWGFRRRAGVAVLALALLVPWPVAHASGWWQRDDQAAHARLEQGNAAYRQGDYAAATAQYQDVDSADGHYNRGNALARAARYPEAIRAYDEALRRQPGMPDAIANRRAVEAAMKRRPPPGAGQGGQPQKPGDSGAASAGGTDPDRMDPDRSQPSKTGSPPSQRDRQGPSKPPQAADAQAQADADRAQRERMQRALEQGAKQPALQAPDAPPETPAQRERRLANEAALQRVPDDPGGLLRAKFRIEHERRLLRGRDGD